MTSADPSALLYILRFRELTYSLGASAESGARFTISLLAVLHAIRVAATVTSTPAYHAYSIPHYLVAVFCLAWGGSTTITIALANPPEWLYRNENIVTYLTVALGLYHFRQLRSFAANPIVRTLCQFADGLCRVNAMSRFAIDPIFRIAKGGAMPIVPAIAAGIFASVGGGLVDRAFGISRQTWRLMAPTSGAFSGPEIALAAACSATYTLLLTATQMPRSNVLALVSWMSALGLPTISIVRRMYFAVGGDALDEITSSIAPASRKRSSIIDSSMMGSGFSSARRQSSIKQSAARIPLSDPESDREESMAASLLSDGGESSVPLKKTARRSGKRAVTNNTDTDGTSPLPLPAKRSRSTRVSRANAAAESDTAVGLQSSPGPSPAPPVRRMRSKSRTSTQ